MQKFSTPNHGSSQDRLTSARPCPTYCSLAMVHQATVAPSPWSASLRWLPPTATQTPRGPSQNQHMHRSSCGAGNVNSSLPETSCQVQREWDFWANFCRQLSHSCFIWRDVLCYCNQIKVSNLQKTINLRLLHFIWPKKTPHNYMIVGFWLYSVSAVRF